MLLDETQFICELIFAGRIHENKHRSGVTKAWPNLSYVDKNFSVCDDHN